MPYFFTLPTISQVFIPSYVTSPTYPSLPLATTTARTVLRGSLKAHKRLSSAQQSSDLGHVSEALNDYIKYIYGLVQLSSGVESDSSSASAASLKSEWRTPSKKQVATTPKAELIQALSTLAITQSDLARNILYPLFTSSTKVDKDKVLSGSSAQFLSAGGIAAYLTTQDEAGAVHHEALKQLMWAEATLLFVRKDDPYPSVVAQDRDASDNEWMYKAPTIAKARALLDARLCLGAAEHAAKATAGLADEDVRRYAASLRSVARARACRFFGMDREMEAQTGEGIAWLRGARKELGLKEEAKGGLRKLKKNWGERKEDKKVERGQNWGLDAGKWEEARILDMLLAKWEKMNDTMNTQLIPPSEPLIAGMPSGRECCAIPKYSPPVLDEATLESMRAPPDPVGQDGQEQGSDSDDEGAFGQVPGAYPGAASKGGERDAYY